MSLGAWAEGDSLSPTNLNNRGGGAFSTTSVYNAGWSRFTASTNTGAIQNTINQASTDGVTAVFVPASMLPYNASTVSFINSVHMIREGGNPTLQEYDPVAYGAAGTDTQDDQPALQACLDAIVNGPRTVRLTYTNNIAPRFQIAKPLWIKTSGTRIVGARESLPGGFNPEIGQSYRYGPAIFIGTSTLTVPNIVSALLSGTGSAWKIVDTNSWFNLRDALTLDLNGLSAFGVEGRWNPTDANDGTIIGSSGKWLQGDTNTICFSVSISTGKFRFVLNTSISGTTTLTGTTTLIAGTSYDFAATYDGSTMRLFVNGALEASSAVTGTLVQGAAEDVTTGAPVALAPDQNKLSNPAHGTIDGLWIRNVAGRTANYTPSGTKPTNDSNTLALMNFVTQYGPFTLVKTKDGDFWAWCRLIGVGGGPNGVELEGFSIGSVNYDGSGIYVAFSCNSLSLRRLVIQNYRNAFYMPLGDSYRWHAEDLFLSQGGAGTGRYGFVCGGNAGLYNLQNLYCEGGVLPLVLLSNGGTITEAHILSQLNTVFHTLLMNNSTAGGPHVLNSYVCDTETGVSSAFRAAIGIGRTGGVTGTGAIFNGGDFSTGQAQPHVIADQNDILMFNGCNFVCASGQTFVMKQLTAPVNPALFVGCQQSGASSGIPWSNTSGAVTFIGDRSHVTVGPTLAAPYLSSNTTNGSGTSATIFDGEWRVVALSTTSAQIGIRSGNTTYLFNAAGTAV